MDENESFHITLPHDVAQMVRDKVASGAYESESDVIRDGLRALQARDAVVERWLLEEVVPTFDRVASGEERLIPADDVFAGLESRYHARKTQKRA
jgi:putative addiction module CopG family antidote